MSDITYFFTKHQRKTYLFIFFLVLSSLSITAHAQESRLAEAPIIIDDNPFSTKYMLREGHLLVPALFFKNTGAYVDWNETYHSVVFRAKNIQFALPVGENYSDNFDRATNTWEREPLPIETIEFGGEPFVPLVNVAQKLGMTVSYDSEVARTFITTNISVAPNIIAHGNTTEKLVALTFDDGPDSRYTPQILDVLKEKGAPATFFVLGNQIKQFPNEMKRIVSEGHGIANHTWNHPNLKRVWSQKVVEEIQSTQAEMEKVVGRKPDLFRPPFGAYTKSDIAVFNELGMKNMMWSVDTLDWSGLSGDEILAIVKRDISPGGIILQHNFQSDEALLDGTVEALPRMIDDLRGKGYTFVTLQTLLANQNR